MRTVKTKKKTTITMANLTPDDRDANFVTLACAHWQIEQRFDMLVKAKQNGTLNALCRLIRRTYTLALQLQYIVLLGL